MILFYSTVLSLKNGSIKPLLARFRIFQAFFRLFYFLHSTCQVTRIPVLPNKRPMGKNGFFRPYEFVYDEYFDCVLCPENNVLMYTTTTREGCCQFKSDPKICENCPSKSKCTEIRNSVKIVEKHIWIDYLELVEDYRHTPSLRKL